MDIIRVGSRFYSYVSLERAIKKFGEANNIVFWKRDCKTLDVCRHHIRRIVDSPPELKYYIIKYACIGGGRLHRSRLTTGKRQVKTFRQGCPAFIKVLLSKDSKSLQVVDMNLEHNHMISRELYETLPSVRKLSPLWQERVRNCMNLKVKRKLLLKAVIEETGKQVTLTDLHNIRSRYKKLEKQATQQETTIQNENNDVYPYEMLECTVASIDNNSILEQDVQKSPIIFTIKAEPENKISEEIGENAAGTTQSENDMFQISTDSRECIIQSENDVSEAASNSACEDVETENAPRSSKSPEVFDIQSNDSVTEQVKQLQQLLRKGNLSQILSPQPMKTQKDEFVKKLLENQQETNREIKTMNLHLAEIAQVLKRIETKLSSTDVNDT